MKVRSLLIVMAVGLALAACNGERATVTGSYGEGLLAGQVTIADMENLSPAGVEVSVRGTGMTTVLGEDGRFTFAGVPANAVLDFRRGDGIDASMVVTQATRSLKVELNRSGAKPAKGNRGQGSGGQKKYEFEGTVRSASATELVVFTSHREEVTIALDADTVIRKGNETLASGADITVGTRVHVRARKVDDAFVASLVIVQNPGEDDGGEDDGPTVKEYEGTIVSAGETELVVYTSHKEEVTFVLNGDTVIRKGNTPVAAGDLQAGWRVHVKATSEGDVNTAVLVIVQKDK